MRFDDHVVITMVVLCSLSLSYALTESTNKSLCPMNFEYVLSISWNSSACQGNHQDITTDDNSTSSCCQTLLSLYGIAHANYLKETSFFRLPDLPTSISCLSDFQSKLNSLSLPKNLTSSCFEPQNYVRTTNICSNIKTKQDWLDTVGHSSPLDSACRKDVSHLPFCDACVLAGFQVHSTLLAADGNSSHAKGCFHYAVLYAGGIVNDLGPHSMGAVTCIFGLPLFLQEKSNSIANLALIFASSGAVFSILTLALFLGLYFWLNGRKKRTTPMENLDFSVRVDYQGAQLHSRATPGLTWFKIQELKKATNNFSQRNVMGSSQFNMVYRGTLQDGTMVAVKKHVESEIQGVNEFRNEIEIISNLKHRNLVPLRGFCVTNANGSDEESQRYLVYDYMPNGNLRDCLFFSQESRIGQRSLSWPQRKSIILDVAKALTYLHYGVRPSIYHRDIKATNILLDANMRARVADFGLARQTREGQSYLSTRIAGTHGYLAPESALYGQLTAKSDVYSFGVTVLEIMCGRKALDLSPSESPNTYLITDWAWSLVKKGKLEEVFDSSMLRDGESASRNSKAVMERFVMVGILCAHVMVAFRPTILDALKMLEGDLEVPVVPDRPIYFEFLGMPLL